MESTRQQLPQNPRERANPISALFLMWTFPLFKKGYQKTLQPEDLYAALKSDESDLLGNVLERHFLKDVKRCEELRKSAGIADPRKGPRPSLAKALFKTLWTDLLYLGVLTVLNELVCKLSIPVLLGRLLHHFRPDSSSSSEDMAWCAVAIVLLSGVSALTYNHNYVGGYHMGMRARIAVCSLIYRKSLKLSRSALGESAPGKVVNLLSNDVARFDIVCVFLHYLWAGPMASIFVLYFVYNEVGVSGVFGIIVVFSVVPILAYIGKLSAEFRLQIAIMTDERVRLMGEIISGVQVIKMYAWEKPFEALINLARKMEIKVIRKTSYFRGVYMTFLLITSRSAMFCSMASMVAFGVSITAEKVFVMSAYFTLLSHLMSSMFVRAVTEVSEARVSLNRLQQYLDQDEFIDNRKTITSAPKSAKTKSKSNKKRNRWTMKKNVVEKRSVNVNKFLEYDKLNGDSILTNDTDTDDCNDHMDIVEGDVLDSALIKKAAEKKIALNLKKVSATWVKDSKVPTLFIENIEIKKGKLIGVIGPVGAGKSSLLQILLGELPISSGNMEMKGTVSYASQEAWLFGGTVRQNILFGLPFDKVRYYEVVKVCALQPDFLQFPFGDQTLVGERGTSLSGGQRARINLARCVYRNSDIYLLDDPLSAVDTHVGNHLFDQCVRGYLKHKTRILVTHQLHFLKAADYILLIEDGRISLQGPSATVLSSSLEYSSSLPAPAEDSNKMDRSASKGRFNSVASQLTQWGDSVCSSVRDFGDLAGDFAGEDDDDNKPQVIRAEESSKNADINVGMEYLRAGASYFGIFLVASAFLLAQAVVLMADYWISFWTSQEELMDYYTSQLSQNGTSLLYNLIDENNTTASASSLKNESNVFLDEALFFKNESNISMNQTQGLSRDSAMEGVKALLTTETCLKIHGYILLSLLVISVVRSTAFYNMCMKASQNLHNSMFRGVIRSPMSFFNCNPSGRIMNRFSKDLGNVDEWLPKAILDALQNVLLVFGSVILTAYINPVFIIPCAVLVVVFFAIRKIYLKTSKNIKRLEGISRSPVFTHLNATLQGLSTIRAFGAQEILKAEFDNFQDLHTSSWYLFIMTTSAFGIVLDMLCFIYIAFVTFTFLVIASSILGDKVGLAITQSLSLSAALQWGIRQSAEVFNQLMAVERVLEYKLLPTEHGNAFDDPKDKSQKPLLGTTLTLVDPPADWPREGRIQFKDFYMKYSEKPEEPYVLKGLNFEFLSREKIGIVGRTGAGKSSLISALFRLAYSEGAVIIDDVDTKTITLENLRKKISIIPQDPVLFMGTLRRNLDPFEEFTDDALWQALEEVELKESLGDGLGCHVMDGGANFSVGQRQLVCLARALLRNNRLLMLDEATANVDPHTDHLIQRTIRDKFVNCTVLTVAHRLNTIMDSDKVLVMDNGQAKEFDHPYQLLQNKDGFLYKMAVETGKQTAAQLYAVAKESYLKLNSKLDENLNAK